MKNVMRKLWKDEAGFVVSVELILIATILVIGLVSGLTMLRDSVLAELGDLAGAIGALDQSYDVGGASYALGEASSASMGWTDAQDAGDSSTNGGVSLAVTGGLTVVNSGVDYSTTGFESGTGASGS
jgi:Flp pilus assembly pilin Flp